jgi:hypothetical protein
MRLFRRAALLTLFLGAGCTGDPPPPDSRPRPDLPVADSEYPTLPDSLALTAPGGAAVWFSGARVGTDSLGGTCTERGLVIVRGDSRILVPLLMTGATPELVNDTTIRARIWLHCRPGNTYEVNLRTGTPTRVQ